MNEAGPDSRRKSDCCRGAGTNSLCEEHLVQVAHSGISIGTEMAGVRMSGLPSYQRALKQPENVKRVLEMVRDQGVKRTLDRVTGYSASGLVIRGRPGGGLGSDSHNVIRSFPPNSTWRIRDRIC
jgi:hypothetical protein